MTLIPPQRSEPHTVDPGTLFEALANMEHSVITTLNAGDYILVSRVTDNMQLDRRLMTLNDLQLLFSQPAFSVTGDITSVGNVTTIAQDVVTFAKMQNVAGHSMLARVASTTGDLSEVTLAVEELIGRGDTGNIGPITLGAGLQMVGRELSATNTFSGTVTTLSVATANGISGSVATATSTPVITLTLGAITPTSVNGVIFQAGTGTPNLTVNGAVFVTGTNSGDQTISDATITFSDITTGNFTISQHGFVPKGTNLGKFLRDDGTWATVASGGTVTEVTSADLAHATIATGTTTPVITIVSAPILTTARTIGGVSFDGSANITVATATGGFTVSGGNLALTTNSITMTGSIGETGSRITKLWATDIEATNAIVGSVTGNAGTVTNATLTTALTVNTGTVTLTGNVANNSVLTIGAGAVSVSGSNTGDQTSVTGNAGTATALQTARTIGGVSFDGTANITVATATGGFTVSGGNLVLGTNSITLTGSIGETGARVTKLWATDIEATNAIVGSITGNAATVTNATLTTALTVNTGTVTLTGNAANNSVLTIGAGAVSVSGSNTGDQTISDATISITDITTNNASITQHGFLKKLSNVSTEFMDGTGNWSTPVGGYTNLTSFVGQTAWRVFYSDSFGDVTELALGADGTFLKSNGASVAPSFATPAGSGDVSKVGTPANNQIGVWTGDGTIEGASSLTYDGANFQLTGDIGATGARITKGWFTDLQVTNAIAGSITGNAATSTTAPTTAVLVDQTAGQTIGATGARLTKLWATDITVTNAIVGSITGNAATVTTNANLTGHITSTGNAAVLGSFTKAQLDAAVSDGNVLYTDAIGVSVQAYDADLTTWAGITPGTGVATALAVAVGSAGAFVTFNGAGGTPSSMTATNLTGTATALNIGGNAATATLATTATTATGTNALYSATTTVNVSSATAPTAGQVLTATGASAATWQTPAGGAATAKSINQVAHGLAVNDVIKFSGSSYAKAQADSAANAEVVGVVTSVADADNFTFTMEGFATLGTLVSDTVYFLSPTTAGLLTATEPTTAGQISKPVLKTTSTTTGIINNMRGLELSENDVPTTTYVETFLGTESTGDDNKTFTLTTGTFSNAKYLEVYLNGILQDEGASDDYVATGTTQAVFNSVVLDTDRITLRVRSAVSSGMTNPMTTAGDIIYGGTAGAPTRLAAGTATHVLTSNGPGVAPSYQAPSTPTGIGWALESYTTSASSTSFSVTGLDLATDLRYKFIVEADALAASSGTYTFTINSVTTGASYIPTGGENNNDASAAGAGTLDFEDTAMNYMTSQCNSMHMEMNASLLTYDGTNARPVFQWDVAGLGQDSTMKVFHVRGSGYQNTQTNVTSIQFKCNIARAWKVWVFRATTS